MRIPYAAEYFAVEDVELLVELLLVIRGRLDAHQAVQREAHGR